MKDLIEALQILLKYANDIGFPIQCEHETLYIRAGINNLERIDEKDVKRLDELGFSWCKEAKGYMSTRFG